MKLLKDILCGWGDSCCAKKLELQHVVCSPRGVLRRKNSSDSLSITQIYVNFVSCAEPKLLSSFKIFLLTGKSLGVWRREKEFLRSTQARRGEEKYLFALAYKKT
jgi:hypothetical protein